MFQNVFIFNCLWYTYLCYEVPFMLTFSWLLENVQQPNDTSQLKKAQNSVMFINVGLSL